MHLSHSLVVEFQPDAVPDQVEAPNRFVKGRTPAQCMAGRWCCQGVPRRQVHRLEDGAILAFGGERGTFRSPRSYWG